MQVCHSLLVYKGSIMSIVVFWIVVLCGLLGSYQHFGECITIRVIFVLNSILVL
jgi:hypothetical protein